MKNLAAVILLVPLALLGGCAGMQYSVTPYAQYNGNDGRVADSWSAGVSVTLFSSLPAVPAVPVIYQIQNNTNVQTGGASSSASSESNQSQSQTCTGGCGKCGKCNPGKKKGHDKKD